MAEPQSADAKIIKEAKDRFQEGDDAWSEVKRNYIMDTKFARLGDQWPPDVARTRELEGKPCLTVNKMPAFARQVVNDMRKNRPRIKTRPVNSSACAKVADIYDGLIRNIEAVSDADVAYDTAGETAVYGGIGFFRIDVDYEYDDSFDMGIFIRAMDNPLAVTWDPFSNVADSSDWRYCFISEIVPKEQQEAEYPDSTTNPQDFGSESVDIGWLTTEGIRRSEYWKREEVEKTIAKLANGEIVDEQLYKKLTEEQQALPEFQIVGTRVTKSYKITQYLMTGAEILKTTPWAGCYMPIIPVWGEAVNVEGRRYYQSMFRHVKDAQRMFNYWRTTATELVSLAPKQPWVGEEGVFTPDIEKWQSANQKNWPILQYKKGMQRPQREALPQVPAAAITEAANAADDMKSILGLFDASLGAKSNETSGIAIQRRMAEGDQSTFHFIDNLNRAIRCAGRAVVDLIPRVYNKPRILRVLGLDGKCQNVPVNQPQQMNPLNGEPLNEVFDLTVGKYDVEVEAGPSYTTQRTETAEMITQVIGAAPQTAPLLAPMLLKMSDFPEADKISNILATMMPPAARAAMDGTPPPPPSPPHEVIAAQQKAQADMQIEGQKAQHQFQLNQQQAQHKQQLESTQAQADIVVMQQKAAAEMQIERERAALQMQLKREEAQLAAQLKLIGASATAPSNVAPGVM